MLTRKQLEEKIAATLAELGLSQPEEAEVVGVEDDTLGMLLKLDPEEVDALDVAQLRKIEELKYELTAAVNGTEVTWSTVPLHPDDVRNEKGEDGQEELRVVLETSGQDLRSMFQMSQLGVALADMIFGLIEALEAGNTEDGGKVLHEKMTTALKFAQSVFPSPMHMASAVYKTNELGNFVQESWNRDRAARDLEALETLSEGLTVDEFLATAAADGKKEEEDE